MIGWKITLYFLDQSEVKPKLHVTSSLMRTCLPGLAPAYCICCEFWLVYLIVCSFCDWPEEIAFVLFSLRSFVKGFEKISLWCVLFFFLNIGLSASPSKSDPFAMDPFQSTFPSSKVSAMIILHFHQIGNLLRWSFFTFKVHLAEQRSPFFYLISHLQST